MADGTEAQILIPSYWRDQPGYYDYVAPTVPAGTVFCGAPGFRNDLAWYASPTGPTGAGPGQAQTRDATAAAAIINLRSYGAKVLPYVAMNAAKAGAGFDGHYSDLAA